MTKVHFGRSNIFPIFGMVCYFTILGVGNLANAKIGRDIVCSKYVLPEQKVECGWIGITGEQCEDLGCCYNRKRASGPFCYIGIGGDFSGSEHCDSGNPIKRRKCGWDYITKSHCESLDCCYDNRVSGAHSCFMSEQIMPNEEIRVVVYTANGVEISDIERLILAQRNAISVLQTLQSQILKVHRDYSIAKTVGSSVSIVSTVATIGGIFLAPFTAGTSLAFTFGGLGGILLGAGTTVTVGILEINKAMEWAKQLQEVLAEREGELKRIGEKILAHPDWMQYVDTVSALATHSASKHKPGKAVWRILKYLAATAVDYGVHMYLTFLTGTVNLSGQAVRLSSKTLAQNVGKIGVKAVSGVGGIVGIGADVAMIVDTWIREPETAKNIEVLIEYLEESSQKLEDLMKDYTD